MEQRGIYVFVHDVDDCSSKSWTKKVLTVICHRPKRQVLSIGDTLTIGSVKLKYRYVDFDIRGVSVLFRNGATSLPGFSGRINRYAE